jgi:hypothetical protein
MQKLYRFLSAEKVGSAWFRILIRQNDPDPDPDQQCMEKTGCRESLLIKKYKILSAAFFSSASSDGEPLSGSYVGEDK